jgi:hypothetical protein
MIIKIPKSIQEYFSSYKNKFNKNEKDSNYDYTQNVIGKLFWICPDNVLWLYSTDNKEDYEGHQTQIGITREGKVVWGFFSHCSCYGYEDYKREFEELKEENDIHTEKVYELKDVDKDILKIINYRIKQIVKIGLKD